MKKPWNLTLGLSALLLVLSAWWVGPTAPGWKQQTVREVLAELGEPLPEHYLAPDSAQVALGRALVYEGRVALPEGGYSPYISKYFMCTSCHNNEREDPVLSIADPEARLPYVVEQGIPFLQGSTFWGIVNRESWYNDDYYLKYGENVRAANHDLRKAIQLCAIECSQGRPLVQWEEDAILAFYWSLELDMDDLTLPTEVEEAITQAVAAGQPNPELVATLKSYYATTSPATFGHIPEDKAAGYGLQGSAEEGKLLYENSCRHCHKEGGVSDFLIDYATHTFRYLERNMEKDNDFSLYQIVRKGTYASPGARPYMPHYPEEKMSDRQIESLRLYIEQQAKGN